MSGMRCGNVRGRRAARLLAPLLAMGLLTACDQSQGGGAYGVEQAESAKIAVTGSRVNRDAQGMEFAAAGAPPAPAPPPPPPPPPPPNGAGANDAGQQADPAPAGGTLLAYSYSVGFEAPVRSVSALKDRHEAECRAAGPRVCQVLGGSINGDGETYIYGNLTIRAEPGWLEGFRAGLAQDAEDADGEITSSSTSTEDLTLNITDTQAQLSAQETLRDRLQALLLRDTDAVDDLLAVERELARVQGQIDSARSQLAVMRARVDMSRLDLSYQGRAAAVSSGGDNPVARAFDDFLYTLSGSVAALITLFAAILPFLIVLVPLAWLLFRWLRRRRRKAA